MMDNQLDELWTDLVANVAGSSMTPEEKRRMYRDTLTMMEKTGWKGYETVEMVDTQMIEAFSDVGLLRSWHLDKVLERLERTIVNRQSRPETQDEQNDLMWNDAKEYFRWKMRRGQLLDEENRVKVLPTSLT
jgi:hypothetical protein